MNKIIAGLLLLVGIIHLMPVSGVLGVERLVALYGISVDGPNLDILMRHRAVLLGLLGLFLIYAAFQPSLRFSAIVAGLISAVSFIAIAVLVGDYNEPIHKVVVADIVATVLLIAAGAIQIFSRGQK